MLAVADVFEALTAARPYRAPLPPDAALEHLRAEVRGGRLDGDCVEALRAALLALPPQASSGGSAFGPSG